MGIIQEIEDNILPKQKLFIKYKKLQEYRHLNSLYKLLMEQKQCGNSSSKTYGQLQKAFNKAKYTLAVLTDFEYQKQFDSTSKECDEKFDEVEGLAKELAKTNGTINKCINGYHEKDRNYLNKVEYYLFLKHELYKPKSKKQIKKENEKNKRKKSC